MKKQNKQQQKERLTLFLLWFFFGIFSVHRFYTGKIWTAILQIITLGGFGFWLLIDGIFIISGNFKDKHGNKIKKWN